MRLVVALLLLLVALASLTDVHAQLKLRLVSIKSVSSGRYLHGGTTTTDRSPRLVVPNLEGETYTDGSPEAWYENFYQWILKDLGHGRVAIKSVSSGLYLDGRDTGMEQPWLSSADRNYWKDEYLQWVISSVGEGRVSLQSVSSAGYLDGRHPLMEHPLIVMGTARPWNDTCLQWEIVDLQPSARLVSLFSMSSKQYLDGHDSTLRPLLSPGNSDPFDNEDFQWVFTKVQTEVGKNWVTIKSVSSRNYLDAYVTDIEASLGLTAPTLRLPYSKAYRNFGLGTWRIETKGAISNVGSSVTFLNGRDSGMQTPLMIRIGLPPLPDDIYLQWLITDLTTLEAFSTGP